MRHGFPVHWLAILRCPADAGSLVVRSVNLGTPTHVAQGTIACSACDRVYAIEDGMLNLLDETQLDGESERERQTRDEEASAGVEWQQSEWSRIDMEPTLQAAEPLRDARVLEFGAGTGRYTIAMLERGAAVMAVDFSARSLAQLARNAEPGGDLAMVIADCTTFATEPESFDLVMSTLVSNLPTEQHRARMFSAAARACRDGAKFVFTTHHFSARSRMLHVPRSGYYSGVPIYRYLFRAREIQRETAAYFGRISCRPIQVAIPFAARLHLPIVKLSRLAEHIPLLNEFGELLLVVARNTVTSRRVSRPFAT